MHHQHGTYQDLYSAETGIYHKTDMHGCYVAILSLLWLCLLSSVAFPKEKLIALCYAVFSTLAKTIYIYPAVCLHPSYCLSTGECVQYNAETSTYTFTHTCFSTHVPVRTRACVHTWLYAYVLVYTRACTHTCLCTHVPVRMHAPYLHSINCPPRQNASLGLTYQYVYHENWIVLKSKIGLPESLAPSPEIYIGI